MTVPNVRTALRLICCASFVVSPGFAYQNGGGEKTDPQENQKPLTKRSMARGFDIRAQTAAPDGVTMPAVVEKRRTEAAALEQRLARERGAVRLNLNEFGLPRSISRENRALTGPSDDPAETIAKRFLREQRQVFRFSDAEIGALRLLRTEKSDGLQFLRFNQTLNGIDVFEGQVRVVLDGRGQVVEAGAGTVIPGLSVGTKSRLNPEQAVGAAYRTLGLLPPDQLHPFTRALEDWTLYEHPKGEDFSPIAVALSIFPMDAESAVLAFRILLEVDGSNWYEILLDAETGRLLLLHNLYRQKAFGRVWRKSPLDGSQTVVEFSTSGGTNNSDLADGRSISLSAWLPSSGTVTTGNNVDAYLDTNGDNKPDTTTGSGIANGRASASDQQFGYPTGDRTTLQDPQNFKAAAVTSLFYFVNLAHDYYYSLGFDEASGNFQTNNFGLGGKDSDPVLAQAQDGSETDNASFATTPDGLSPRMHAGLITYGTTETYATSWNDSDYDGMVILHEYGHGVTNRIVGGGTATSCLSGIQSGALGEGWSDYFAISHFNDPVMAPYIAVDPYSGIRRASYNHYPYTYEDLGNHDYEVHNDGEIWAGTLWDIRNSLGPAVTDRLVVNGLRFTACGPTMNDARDAIIVADQYTNGGANRQALWTVFARHGLGYAAAGYDGNWRQGTVFAAAYDLPPDLQTGNRPPIVHTGRIPNPAFGSPFTYQINAQDPDGGTLNYRLVRGPSGMTVDANTGLLQWSTTFTSADARIAITDGQGGRVVHGISLHVETPLTLGSALSVGGTEQSYGYATMTVPAGAPVLQVTLRGGGGDADIVLYDPDGLVAGISERDGTAETLSVPTPKAGQWLIEADGYRDYWGVGLTAATPVPRVLTIPGTLSGLSGDYSSETFFQVNVPAGAPVLKVSTSGGSGDMDLFVRRGAVPVCQESSSVYEPCAYDAHSDYSNTNNESVIITSPAAGAYYIDLMGYQQYSNVTLTLDVVPPLTVSEKMFTKAVGTSGCTPPVATTNFLTTDPIVYIWFLVSGASLGDIATMAWLEPNGSTYSTAVWGSVSAPGSICFWVGIYIAGHTPASLPGTWTGNVFWNGLPLFSSSFTIANP
jgi:hypothetical protein